MDVAVLGSGAMGSLFGGRLAQAGMAVSFIDVWEEHVDALNDAGLVIETSDGTERVSDVRATTSPGSVGPVDLLLVFVKSIHTRDALVDATPLLDGADVLTLQNGLGNPETLAEFVDESRVIAGVTAHGSTMVGPGHIRHAGSGQTTIGRYFVENDDRVTAIAERFAAAGIDTTVSSEITDAIWEKVLVNVGINAATALARVRNERLTTADPGQRLVDRAVSEAAAVADAEGIDIRTDIVDHVLEIADRTGSNRSSMRQDVEAGRTTEIETLNGAVVNRAEAHGIDTPVNRTLADLVRLAETGSNESAPD
jgi:2-dehydropantoate 2-reductase